MASVRNEKCKFFGVNTITTMPEYRLARDLCRVFGESSNAELVIDVNTLLVLKYVSSAVQRTRALMLMIRSLQIDAKILWPYGTLVLILTASVGDLSSAVSSEVGKAIN